MAHSESVDKSPVVETITDEAETLNESCLVGNKSSDEALYEMPLHKRPQSFVQNKDENTRKNKRFIRTVQGY